VISELGRALSAVGLVALVAGASLVACHDQPICHAGDWTECRCEDGRAGYAPCDAADGEGEGYGACRCDGTPGLEEGSGGGAAGALYTPCEIDADCDSGLCFPFNSRGPHCTLACDDGTECPAPSSGCNDKGVCKPL
jgi:hypothetical protein